jgi:lipopolysaccharide/colanic/teichoic acid biosynthesis glycosyltransferase
MHRGSWMVRKRGNVRGLMRNFARVGIDLALVGFSAFLALFIRDNFVASIPRLQAIAPYALLSVASAAIIFSVANVNRTVWRYTSLLDVLHLVAAVTVALLLAVLAGFAVNRLEDVSRALPVIQWFVLVGSLIGARISARMWQERGDRPRKSLPTPTAMQHVLVVGVNDLTELYLSSIAEFAPAKLAVVGILARGRSLRGRSIRQYKVLGPPEEISRVVRELDVHGISVDRIVVMQPFEQLSRAAQEALIGVERSTGIKVEWLLETLGWGANESGVVETGDHSFPRLDDDASLSRRGRASVKRAIDLFTAIGLAVALWPILTLISLIVAIDVGLPTVFWQQRPGRYGRPFKLYKFRTMHSAHDAHGNRIPEELRSSRLGSFLRRSRLDELPQLYNIIVGEMSFVGPRPLLAIDQPRGHVLRLMARPGLTGWAQINGGREISNEDKAALDIWYIMNLSLWLDIKILLRTIAFIIFGDRVNGMAVKAAHARLEEMRIKAPVGAAHDGSVRRERLSADEAA